METKSALPSDVHITRGMATMVDILVICLLAACGNGSVTRQPGPVAGVGGQQGGASIGLLLVNSTVTTVPDQFNRLLMFGLSISGGCVERQVSVPSPLVSGPTPACPPSLVANGHDYHGLTLELCSFSGQDLTNANFNGATLTGVVFIKTNTGADFSNAYLFGVDITGATYDKAPSDQSVICKNNATVDTNW